MEATLKNNKTSWWPRLIIATFILFGFYIGFMVWQAMQTNVDLVSPDYYKKEIAYQQHINQVSQTQALKQPVTITLDESTKQLTLKFPEDFAGQQITGQVQFFRPSDAQLDFQLPLQPESNRQQHLNTAQLAQGHWRVQVSWEVANQKYFYQKDLTIK